VGVPIGAAKGPLSVKTCKGKVDLEPLFLEHVVGLLPGTKFNVAAERDYSNYDRTTTKAYQGLVSDRQAYLHALSLGESVRYLINRNELAHEVLVPLARNLHQTMHAHDRVHCDVKPANILFMFGAAKLIDSRGCSSGAIAATYTPQWCAPEQTLGKPVAPSADVYGLGMLVLALIGAQLHGEVKNFKVPSFDSSSASTIQVLATEGVWIETNCGLSDEARAAWREALARWLAFDPAHRSQHGEQFAQELEALLKKHPLTSLKDLELKGHECARLGRTDPKSLEGLVDEEVGVRCAVYPAWILEDSYPSITS